MGTWSGYILLQKPAILPAADWQTVLIALRAILGKRDDSDMPSERLHYRLSNDKSKVLIQATFDEDDLVPGDKTRLAKYVSNALAGKYTPTQCATALANNVTIYQPRKGREIGAAEVQAWLAANAAEWETAENVERSQ